MDLYTENILHHYKNPKNSGKIENATVSAEEFNPLCGDKIKIYLSLDDDEKVVDIKFEGEGCAISQASASMLTDKIKGKTIKEIKEIDNEEIYQMLGVPIGPGRVKCALLSLITVKKAALTEEIKKNS